MRIVVTGASGNVGTAVVRKLVAHDAVDEVVGICRRPHDWRPARTRWVHLDVATDELAPTLAGADAVIHLAWLFQPTHQPDVTWRANVLGTQRLLAAVEAAGVPAVVVASSVGAYSPRTSLDPVDESWPTMGYAGAAYSREKSYVERMLDHHEALHPHRRVVRMRPAFIFQQWAALEQRRLFLGPFVPHALLVRGRLPVLPLPRELHLQALQADDVAAAYAEAALRSVHGAFNLGTDVLDPGAIGEALGSRWLPMPAAMMKGVVTAAFQAHLVPASPGLFELALRIPMLSSERARRELGWSPGFDARGAIGEFLQGIGRGEDGPTPPLAASTSGPARSLEVAAGVGERP
jgi:nucleoside-diphosphate-sugar epimerase